MTIAEAIANIDAIKPNAYTTTEKIKWLSTLDGRIKYLICDNYTEEVEWEEYTDTTEVLLVPAPWDNIYEYYLAACIDRSNDEIDLYNNDIALYNSVLSEYRNYYNRTNEHKREAMRYK